MSANLENSEMVTGLKKVSFHSISIQLHSFHLLARLCSNSFKLGLQMYILSLEKAEELEIKFSTPLVHRKSKGIPSKTSSSLTVLKPLTMWITTNCGNFLKRWKYQTTLPGSWETYMQDKKQVSTSHGIMDDSKLRKKDDKAVYCHLSYLTSMQHISHEKLAG